jgi:hypothetical protein
MSKPPRTPTTHLDPEKTLKFFSSLYANPESAKIIAESVPEYVGTEGEEQEDMEEEEEEGMPKGGEEGDATEKEESIEGVPPPALEEATPDAPSTDATLVSGHEVRRACGQMKASCSGKDGVPPDCSSTSLRI